MRVRACARATPGNELWLCIVHISDTANKFKPAPCSLAGFVLNSLVYALQLLSDTESPASVFNALRLFWPEAPRCLVYDNCCNEHDYCLNREAAWFKDTEFYIDNPHFKTHTAAAQPTIPACMRGWSARPWPSSKTSG